MIYDEERFPSVTMNSKREEILLTRKDQCAAFLSMKDGKPLDNLGGVTCHSYIRTPSGHLTDFIGVYNMEELGAPELWEYITSKTEGPFRDFFSDVSEGWSMITDKEGKVYGFRMPDEAFKFKPYPLVYSFLICSRIPHEYSDWCNTFKYLLNRDIDKAKAFILLPYLNYKSHTNSLVSRKNSWDGLHKCLSENTYSNYLIDIKNFYEGKYVVENIEDGTPTSFLWRMTTKNQSVRKTLNKFVWDAYGNPSSTKFGGTVSIINDDGLKKLMEDFDKYVELRYA